MSTMQLFIDKISDSLFFGHQQLSFRIGILNIIFTDPVKLKNNKGIIGDDLGTMGKIFGKFEKE